MSAEIIPMDKQERKCSFCGVRESAAKRFIASTVTSHCICGECVKKAKEKIEAGRVSA